jgi:TonB-dependent SusC/RagA subfamily outer membrane receptor
MMLVLAAAVPATSRAQPAPAAERPKPQEPPVDSLTEWLFGRSVPTSLHSSAIAGSIGADVATITAAELSRSGAASLSEVLKARVPGLSVMREGGTTTQPSIVRMRGPVSRLFTNEPLVMIDGVPTPMPQERRGSSALDDVPIDQIERIDVLRGPAAAALFGPGASAGVIVITTKRAKGGPVSVRARMDGGLIRDRTDYPANYRMTGINPSTGQPAVRCFISDQTAQRCVPQQLLSFNPLEQASPFRTGQELAGTAWADGTLGRTGLMASLGANDRRVSGVTPDDEATRSGAHVDLERSFAQRATAGGTISYERAWTAIPARLPASDVITSALAGSAVDDSSHGYRYGVPTFDDPVSQGVERVGIAGRLSWHPTSWLRILANGGRERTTERERSPILFVSSGGGRTELAGARRDYSRRISGNIGVNLEATTRLRGVGLQSLLGYDERRRRASDETSDSVGSLFGLSSSFVNEHYRSIAWQERAAWRNALYVNAGLLWRVDAGLAREFLRAPFNEIDVSWRVPRIAGVSGLRLRGARGVSGAGFFEPALTPFPGIPGSILPPPQDILDRERTQQTELGVDTPIGRGAVSLTHYHTLTRHLFFPFSAGPSGGGLSIASGLSMKTTGVEASLTQRVLALHSLRWDAAATLATVRGRPLNLGPIVAFRGLYSRFEAGHPPDGYWAQTISYRDTNGDGLIDTTEVHLSPTEEYLGPSSPTLEASLRSNVRLGGWSFGVTLDHRGGYRHFNGMEWYRCSTGICRGSQDPSASLGEQARNYFSTPGPFIENASFVRLQEVSLRWTGAGSSSSDGVLHRMSVSVIARDLATWTGYSGLDPEVATPADGIPSYEGGQAPLPLRVLVRVELLPPLS